MDHSDVFHVATTVFPMLSDMDMGWLYFNIQKRGQIEPVVVYNGKIIDGRARWLVTQRLGRKTKIRQFKGSEDDIVAFIVSKNLDSRNLSKDQMAMVAARIRNVALGSNQHVIRLTHDLNRGEVYDPPLRVSVRELAETGQVAYRLSDLTQLPPRRRASLH